MVILDICTGILKHVKGRR
jgi:hypothetical protein